MTFLPVSPILLALMAPSQGNAALQQVFMFGMIFVIFYFFMILPQQKTRKQHEQRVNELKRGDEIVTVGGLVGEVVHIKEGVKDGAPVKTMEDRITVKSAESRVVIERRSIARVITGSAEAAGSK
jgi:preprotein translocase subunit YajC